MVADGMGGAAGGEVASRLAVDTALITEGTPAERVTKANKVVVEASLREPGLAGMGTTLTMAELGPDDTIRLAHVGDSRAYLLRDGNFEMVTADHTVVAEHVAAGRLSTKDALNHPQRSMLTRVLGLSAEVEVDEIEIEVKEGDRLLICSDGLTNMVPENRIAATLGKASPEEAVWTLIEQANRAGGHDNITVVVVQVIT
jgi:protein phosphatase